MYTTPILPTFIGGWSFQGNIFAVFRFGCVGLELVSAQFVAEFVGLLLVAIVNLFLFFWCRLSCACLAPVTAIFINYSDCIAACIFVSPILYRKDNLGEMAWTANLNPLYRVLNPVRHSLMAGEVQWSVGLLLLAFNVVGLWVALVRLNQERPHLPFQI